MKSLDLSSNPIMCQCGLVWMADMLDKNKTFHSKIQNPSHFQNKTRRRFKTKRLTQATSEHQMTNESIQLEQFKMKHHLHSYQQTYIHGYCFINLVNPTTIQPRQYPANMAKSTNVVRVYNIANHDFDKRFTQRESSSHYLSSFPLDDDLSSISLMHYFTANKDYCRHVENI